MTRGLVCAFLVGALLLAPAARSQTGQKPEDAAVKRAEAWLTLVDQGKYAESWQGAARAFQAGISRDSWAQALGGGRAPLGKLVSRRMSSANHTTSLQGAPEGQYVVIQFNSSFESKKETVETVTAMLDPDGVWRVAGYFIK